MPILRFAAAAVFAAALPVAAAAQTPPALPPAPLVAPPPAPLVAAPAPASPAPRLFDELKFGVLANDIAFLGRHVEAGTDVNFEMLFTPPDILQIIGAPRPDLGVTVNSAGKTQRGYFGLTWGITLIQSLFGTGGGVWVNGSLGGAVHNGYTNSPAFERKELGSPVLFRESLELGYQATPRFSVSGFIEHMSNAGLARHNDGMTDAGARLGVKF